MVSNLGDSRAVLCHLARPGGFHHGDGWKLFQNDQKVTGNPMVEPAGHRGRAGTAVPVSEDHKPTRMDESGVSRGGRK